MSEKKPENATLRLARLTGVVSEYEDAWYHIRKVPIESQQTVLCAMGYDPPDQALEELETRPWNRLISPTIIIPAEKQPTSISLYCPLDATCEQRASITYTLKAEDGSIIGNHTVEIIPIEEHIIRERRHVRLALELVPTLEIGYYILDVEVSSSGFEGKETSRLIVAPDRCHLPRKKTWGISLSLYSLRSKDDWGVGDLECLRQFVSWANKELGAGFVGISPLHAISNRGAYGISPYYPISRLYRNPIYLYLPSILETSETGRAFLTSKETLEEIERLRDTDYVDYEGVVSLKNRALKVAWEAFRKHHLKLNTAEADKFNEYVIRQGKPLELFSTFMALADHLGYDERSPAWDKYHDLNSEAVADFIETHADEITFHQYIQWLIDCQLEVASQASQGMTVGLYSDLAVGSAPGGSDIWSNPDVFAQGVDVGAPPDAFNASGQNWGFPPMSPERLKESGYELFIQTIRHNLRHTGALRIDHALGLFRLFWIPKGIHASEGTYVRYPSEDLLRIIALESKRERSIIIAEDLGTVGADVHKALHQHGMLSYRLLYFERDRHTKRYRPPEEYPELALAAVTTHDLPTLKGFWAMRDIDTRKTLGLYASKEQEEADRKTRTETIEGIEEVLLSTISGRSPQENALAQNDFRSTMVHRFLAKTPSLLVSVSLDDALGLMEQQNLPGVLEGHPNWQRKYPLTVEQLTESNLMEAYIQIFHDEQRVSSST